MLPQQRSAASAGLLLTQLRCPALMHTYALHHISSQESKLVLASKTEGVSIFLPKSCTYRGLAFDDGVK